MPRRGKDIVKDASVELVRCQPLSADYFLSLDSNDVLSFDLGSGDWQASHFLLLKSLLLPVAHRWSMKI